MRNFLEFKSCYRSETAEPASPPPTSHHAVSTGRPELRCQRNLRGRKPSHWRPALSAISEDGVAPFVAENSEGKWGKKASCQGRFAALFSDCDYHRRESAPIFMPALPLTAFTF